MSFNMTFEEFKKLDVLNAYSEFKSVDYAKMTGELPSNLHDHIDSKCLCGSDRMTNGVSITCCNPRCYIKLGHRMSNLFSKFGAKNLGPSTCIKIMKFGIQNEIFVLPSHLEIFMTFDKFEYILGERFYDLILAIDLVHKTPMSFYQMVQSIGIPGYDSKCLDIFKDIESTKHLKEEFDRIGVVQYLSQFGVEDLKMSLNLVLYLGDIYAFERTFRGERIGKILKDVKICVTGPVYPEGAYMKRDDFVRYVNSMSRVNGFQVFNITESGPATATYVIADSPSPSRKYVKAKERESYNPNSKIIYTSTEFVNLIKSEVEKCKESNLT